MRNELGRRRRSCGAAAHQLVLAHQVLKALRTQVKLYFWCLKTCMNQFVLPCEHISMTVCGVISSSYLCSLSFMLRNEIFIKGNTSNNLIKQQRKYSHEHNLNQVHVKTNSKDALDHVASLAVLKVILLCNE